jgi:hypothetical protein
VLAGSIGVEIVKSGQSAADGLSKLNRLLGLDTAGGFLQNGWADA